MNHTTDDESIDGIFYHKFKLYVQPSKLSEDVIIIYATGSDKHDISEGWDWDFHTIYITADNQLGDGVWEISPDKPGHELKGHLVTNLQGEKLFSSFVPFIRAVDIRQETTIASEKIVDKYRVGSVQQINHLVHIKTSNYNFSDPMIKSDILKFLERQTKYELQTLRIIEPYLSEEVFDLIDQAVDKGTTVKILTVQTSNIDNSTIRAKISDLKLKNISIEIKQICRVNQSVNLEKRKTENPFHDRMIIVDNGVLMIGISFNGLFKNNTTVQEYSGANDLKIKFDDWYNGNSFSYGGHTIQFKLFS